MELVDILLELWRRRRWLVVGVVVAGLVALTGLYNVKSLLPLSLEKKSYSVGVASTQMLVDAPQSPIADLGKPFEPLASRASVYSKLIASAPVRQAIGRRVGIPGEAINTAGPSAINQNTGGRPTSSSQRQQELVGEGQSYRLVAVPIEGQPIMSIQAQAPTAEGAMRLADAAIASLKEYVNRQQRRENVLPAYRVRVEQLGDSQGGQINSSADYSLALMSFVGVFIAWCVLVLLSGSLFRGIRRARAEARLNEADEAAAAVAVAPYDTEAAPAEEVELNNRLGHQAEKPRAAARS